MAAVEGRLYDPLAYDSSEEVGSFWQDDVAAPRPVCPTLEGDTTADVVVIGAGYTGLHAALQLARVHDRDVVVLEAGSPGWGASGRNGGFCCMGGSTLSDSRMARQFGESALHQFEQAQMEAVSFVRGFLDENRIDADTHSSGEWQLAHKRHHVPGLEAEAEALKARHGLDARVFPKEALHELGMAGPEFHGVLHVPVGFALHPLKYALGLTETAQRAGVRIHGQSEVLGLERDGEFHLVRTARGSVRARHLLIATNGYVSEATVPALTGVTLPVMSNIIVTRPLTDSEKKAQGWWSDQMAYDTRRLLHYFRLLPDGRFLFGMRGGTDASGYGMVLNEVRIRRHFDRMFPKWRDVEHTHFWAGLVAMTWKQAPYLGPVDGMENSWGAFAYHGNGVALGSWSGRMIADQIAGTASPDAIPVVMRAPPQTFPLPALRLLALRTAYLGYTIRDEWL
ncbi:NAD(P)/FAD-dependent oxidoreductase [Coralliovum pocilloporae]|uniref:NAD(P)/FAD-dependent oxidoreductase n=1 Tax=Coralliovum pocilloporae TaxID=3066369 RepID=UPI0033070046